MTFEWPYALVLLLVAPLLLAYYLAMLRRRRRFAAWHLFTAGEGPCQAGGKLHQAGAQSVDRLT